MKLPLDIISDCQDCGACCTEQAALPVSWFLALAKDEAELLPIRILVELEILKDNFMRNGFPPDGSPCIWFDQQTKKCKHYEYRPSLCKEALMPGDESCLRWRNERNTT